MDTVEFLQNWYLQKCDGEWEHEFSIRIHTVDNPGWCISIDLAGTALEEIVKPYTLIENDENDWYGWKVSEQKFEACGDAGKLKYLIEIFRDFVQANSPHAEK